MSRVTKLAAAHMARHAQPWERGMTLPAWRLYRGTVSRQADRQQAAEGECRYRRKLAVAWIGGLVNTVIMLMLFDTTAMPLVWMVYVLAALWALQEIDAAALMNDIEGDDE